MGLEVPKWTLGDRLTKARTSADLDQAALAQKLGIGRRSLIRYERDEHRPSPAIVIAWAHLTGVPVAWLDGTEVVTDLPTGTVTREKPAPVVLVAV
jgi:transcriptional regulator with XRE-family HTH domain